MTNKKQNNDSYKKLYLVLCPGESNRYVTTFVEAESMAKKMCDDTGEYVDIIEITKSWQVSPPDEPEPFVEEITLQELMELN